MSDAIVRSSTLNASPSGTWPAMLSSAFTPLMAYGFLPAISWASSSAAACGSSATRVARPSSFASVPDTMRTVNASSLATSSPTSRGSICVPVMSGTRPQRISSTDNFASGATMRRSHPSASWMPAPTAAPCTAAIVAAGISVHTYTACWPRFVMRSSRRARSARSPRSSDGSRGSPAICWKLSKSRPEQNPRPAPESTTARTAGLAFSSSPASTSARNIAPSTAFILSGRLSFTSATPPSISMVTLSDMATCSPLGPNTRKTCPRLKRPIAPALTLVALVVGLFGAHAPAAAAEVPTAQMSPELNGVLVDSYPFRTLQSQYQQSANALSSATSLVASSSAELTDLQLEDTRLTTEIEAATTRKKEATVTLAQARAGLRTLAIESYVNGRQEPSLTVDLDVATRLLTDQTLTQAVSEQQSAKLQSSTAALDEAVQTLTTDLSSRTQGRNRMIDVQTAHDQALQDEARLRQALVAQQAALEEARVTATVIGEDFSLVAVDAYWRAAKRMQTDAPACGIPWWALAGITRTESRHGTYGGARLLANGDVDHPIIGIPLDGTNNTAVIGDTDGGAYDGDPVYDRAVGPMQFIPSTWQRWAADGNADGRADPNNIYDAALGAARYLCATGPMRTDDDMRRGFYSYNHSDSYVATVLNYAKGYSRL